MIKICCLVLFISATLPAFLCVPMVENSVKFALERCRQFLNLATYMKNDALNEVNDLKRTYRVCRHLIKAEAFYAENPVEDEEDFVLTAQPLKKEAPKMKMSRHSHRYGGSGDTCYVILFKRQHFQGEEIVLRKDRRDLGYFDVKSLRIIGDKKANSCAWRFFTKANYKGGNFTVKASNALESPDQWGFKVGQLKSARKIKVLIKSAQLIQP